MKRGTGNQSLRKVKGHATEKDAEYGISNVEDREGNDTSDKLADKGVEAIAGICLVKPGKLLETHKKYRKLMVGVHRMIAAVTHAEKQKGKGNTRSKKRFLDSMRSSGSEQMPKFVMKGTLKSNIRSLKP